MGVALFAVVAVAYLLYAARSRENAVVGAAFLVTYNQWVPAAPVTMLNTHTLLLATVGWSLLRRGGPREVEPRPSAGPALALFGLALAAGFVHAQFAEVPARYAFLYDRWLLTLLFKEKASVLFLCWAAFVVTDRAEVARKIAWAGLAGLGLEMLFCLGEYAVGQGRVSGHLQAKNATGAFLAAATALTLGVFLSSAGVRRRWVFGALTAVGAVASLGTSSRGGVLALGIALLAVSLVKSRPAFLVLLLAVASSPLWMPEKLAARFQESFRVERTGEIEAEGTARQRLEIWKAGLRALPDHPAGIGLGLYKMVVPTYGLEATLRNPIKDAHNELILVLVELGLLGLLVYLGLLGGKLLQAWRASRDDPDPFLRAVAFGAGAGLVAALAASMSVSLVLASDVSGVLWILLGVSSRRAADAAARRRAVAAPGRAGAVAAQPSPAGAR